MIKNNKCMCNRQNKKTLLIKNNQINNQNSPNNLSTKLASLRSLLQSNLQGNITHSFIPYNSNIYWPTNGNDIRPYSRILSHLYLGDGRTATDLNVLKRLGITHVLNAAQGSMLGQVATNATYYYHFNIDFFGIPALDSLNFNMMPYFESAADFIDSAIRKRGTVYVHCKVGVSRSASIVLAYLMIKKQMTLENAIKYVQSKRMICPNENFLAQLCTLEQQLCRYKLRM
ncbi:hypothetical protein GJ496_001893 [Pomphorhynchus laevis]|nr:hypothetical protein GJ496_001893 [Pomphorhynchus laevis]